jgi:hypothetical protein
VLIGASDVRQHTEQDVITMLCVIQFPQRSYCQSWMGS